MSIFRINLFLLCLSLLTMSGCAFGTRHVTLNPIKTSLSLDATGQNVYIEVIDKRNPSLKPVVGHVKNGYGMKTADVISDKEVSSWVKDSIVEELKRADAVILPDDKNLDNKTSKIIVDVLVCYAQAYWNYGGEVSVVVTVKKDNKDIIKEKNYTGKATLGTNWGARAASYQEVLELAMEDMLQKLMSDLIAAIKS